MFRDVPWGIQDRNHSGVFPSTPGKGPIRGYSGVEGVRVTSVDTVDGVPKRTDVVRLHRYNLFTGGAAVNRGDILVQRLKSTMHRHPQVRQ